MNVSDEKFCLAVCKEAKALLGMGKITNLTKYNDIVIQLSEIQKAVDDGNMKDKERMDAIEIRLKRLTARVDDMDAAGKPKKKAKKDK